MTGKPHCEPEPRLSELVELLKAAHLPYADIGADLLKNFVAYRDDDGLVAIGGLEIYDTDALLRSIVVADRGRGQNLGTQLVAMIEQRAQQHQVKRLYLLTTDAQKYFAPLGYREIPREQAPIAIRQTQQFTSLCAGTAALMLKKLAVSPTSVP